jgi:2-keto-3-deoxy-L-rhamnonate aldolase RhmA
MAMIRTNNAKKKLRDGGTVIALGGADSPEIVDMLGPSPVDAFWFEGEHGPVDYADIGDLTRACDLWGKTSIVRVGWNQENIIYRTLDRGAQSIVVPHMKSRAIADEVVAAAKFAPIGRRGMWTSRQGYGVDDYLKRANDETMIVCLIEDFDALPELDSILEVDQIDVLLVAQSDFSQSMGMAHMGNPGHPEAVAAIDETLKRIVASGTVAGTNVTAESVGKYVDMGVRFFYTNLSDWLAKSADRFAAAIDSSK